jgi:hypothetical protein
MAFTAFLMTAMSAFLSRGPVLCFDFRRDRLGPFDETPGEHPVVSALLVAADK